MIEDLTVANEVCFFLTREWLKLQKKKKKRFNYFVHPLLHSAVSFGILKKMLCVLRVVNEKNHLMIISQVTLINTASFLKLLFMQK